MARAVLADSPFIEFVIILKSSGREEFGNMEIPSPKPGRINAIAGMTLLSGIINILWSIVLSVALAAFGLVTFPFGCVCIPLGIYPLVLGILETIYAARLIKNPPSPGIKPAFSIAVMEIIDALFGNVIALAVGVLTLIFYNDPAVRRYFGEA